MQPKISLNTRFYQSENEVLMYPARQFEVVSSLNTGNDVRIIHVKEIQPPFPLIHIPPSSTSADRTAKIEPSLSAMHLSQSSSTKTTYKNQRLQQLIEQCKPQSTVDLKEQNLTDEDMEIVVREAMINKQCTDLNLNYNKITSIGASIIADALNNNITLEVLYLMGNLLSDMGVRTLTKVLSLNNSKVGALALQSTGITDEGAEHVAEMLKTNTKLGGLQLGWNEIGDRGVQRLADALTHHNTTIYLLFLDRNKKVSDLSVDSLVEMLKHNQRLTRLNLEECNLSEKGKDRLRQTVKSKKGFDLSV